MILPSLPVPPPPEVTPPTKLPNGGINDSTKGHWTDPNDPSHPTYEVIHPNPARIPLNSLGIHFPDLPEPPYPPADEPFKWQQGTERQFQWIIRLNDGGWSDEINWPHLYARFILSHKDKRILPEDIDLYQYRTRLTCSQPNRNFSSEVKNANDGYFFKLANVSDPSISYYESATFPIGTPRPVHDGDMLLAVLVGVGLFLMLLFGALRGAMRENRRAIEI
ncbi:hypothetical protein Q8F55_008518 [Vanrija albida]|uniref:Uncharacterized protein n=1 Tax=Vanrija albida TaxID=181172 RepID=A0ABR3PR25_9TREE